VRGDDKEVNTMFGQVVQGHTTDPAGARQAMERWARHVSPGATGWVRTIAGVTHHGTFIALLQFDSENAVGINSGRPEQDRWWTEMRGLLDGGVTVENGVRTEAFLAGDPDRAGFVQVVQGRVSDMARAREHLHAMQKLWSLHLTALLGTVTIELSGGRFSRALCWSTELEARAGALETPPEVRARNQAARQQLLVGQPESLDLQEPWLYSAG